MESDQMIVEAERRAACEAGRARRKAQRALRNRSFVGTMITGSISTLMIACKDKFVNSKLINSATTLGVSSTLGFLFCLGYSQWKLLKPDYTDPEEVDEYKQLFRRDLNAFLRAHRPEDIFGTFENFAEALERLLVDKSFSEVMLTLSGDRLLGLMENDSVTLMFRAAFSKWAVGAGSASSPASSSRVELLELAHIEQQSYFESLVLMDADATLVFEEALSAAAAGATLTSITSFLTESNLVNLR
ncbi:hypothetical protein CYMTET_31602, partial [Cymbomonas tetramitiformis]